MGSRTLRWRSLAWPGVERLELAGEPGRVIETDPEGFVLTYPGLFERA